MSNGGQIKAKGGKAPKFLSVLMAAVLLGSIAVDGYCAYDLLGRSVESTSVSEKADEEENSESTEKAKSPERTAFETAQAEKKKKGAAPLLYSLLDGMENKTVSNDNEGLEFIKAMHSELGVKNADTDLVFEKAVDNGEWVFRHYKQMHNGLEVLGGGVTIASDKDTGKVVDVGGKHFDIPEDLKTDPTVTFDQAKDAASNYISSKFGNASDKVRLDNEGTKIVPVSNDVKVGYNVSVTDKNTGKKVGDIVVDSESGDVIAVNPGPNKTVKTDTNKSNNHPQTGDKTNGTKLEDANINKDSDESWTLTDNENNIVITDATDKPTVSVSDLESLPPYTCDPNDQQADQTAIDIINNTEAAHDFYEEVCGRNGINGEGGQTKVVAGAESYEYTDTNGEQKADVTDAATYVGDNTIVVGKDSDPSTPSDQASADEIGKAYTNGVEQNMTDLYEGYTPAGSDPELSEAAAIAEGIAEVMGEFIEDYATDGQLNNSCDWQNSSGDLRAPADANSYKPYETPVSEGKQVITAFAAEIVATGVDALTAAHLFYDVMPTLSAAATFVEFRKNFESLAVEYSLSQTDGRRLTPQQLEAVIDAFDAVGIAVNYDYRLAAEGEIKVVGDDEESFTAFKVKLTSYNDPSVSVFEGEATAETFKLPASVQNGIYILTLSEKDNENSNCSYTVIINNNAPEQKSEAYPDEITAYTHFGAKSRDVVLVIDISGSMDGTPIVQTREAAAKFAETVLTQSPSTRISLVTYSESANDRIIESSNKAVLADAVNDLRAYGGTNTYDGLDHANQILMKSKSEKKLVVLMSDGEPNEGPYEDGYDKPIIKLADEMKQKDITIYTLGFFHNLSGSSLNNCQKLMSAIASEGYDYIVDNADDVQFNVDDPQSDLYKVFNDFAEMINGKKYINIRIACPVDVTVSYNGETLSSNKKHPIARTSFGSLSYEAIIDEETGQESEDNVKILRLEEGADYEVCINGTGKGKMDYSISYPDEEGEYTDVRSFKGVPITKDTVIATSTKQDEKVAMNVDTDGDGKFDLSYAAEKNKKGEETSTGSMMTVILIIVNSLLGVIVVLYIVLAIRKKLAASKAAQPAAPAVCTNCGAALDSTSKFCRSCGTPIASMAVPAAAPEQQAAPIKRSKAPMIIKLAVILVCVCTTSAVLALYYSPATTVFKQLRDNQTQSAQQIYNNSMSETGLSASYLKFLTGHHMSKAEDAYNDQKLTAEDYRTLLEGVKSLKLDDLSDEAKDKLKELNKAVKEGANTEADKPVESKASDESTESEKED